MTRPRIGILALTLELYETIAPGMRKGREEFVRERIITVLEPIADITFDRAVFTREDVEKTVLAYESGGVDAVLVVLLSYSPSLISAPALQRTHLPIIVWNTQELYAVNESYGDAELLANHGVHGTFDLCNVLVRSGVRFSYVTSHVDDPDAAGELDDCFKAASTRARVRRARLGLLGYPFPGMGDFGLDTTRMAMTLGCQWEALSVSEFVGSAADNTPGDVSALVDAYRQEYEIVPEITGDDLDATARAELALRKLIEKYRLDALSYQFLSFGEDERVETLPFVAASRLLAEGIGFGGEGDLISALGTAVLNWLSPPASFNEIFTIDFAGNAVLLSHMGEANVAMARKDRKVTLVKRPESLVPIRGSQLALATAFEPGDATLMALTIAAGQRWRVISSLITIEDFGPLEQLVVPHTKVRFRGDVREFLTDYAEAGGPHHLAICFGDARGRLRILADLMDADYCEVR